jgi:hypothetical protein
MDKFRERFDRIIEEWFAVNLVEYERDDSWMLSQELVCQNCGVKFHAHATDVRELINHVLDDLARMEAR